MLEIAYTQHKGKKRGQQDALWEGESFFQENDMSVAFREADASERIVVAVADGVANSPVPHRASLVCLETLAEGINNGERFDGRLLRHVHGRMCDMLSKGKTFGSSTTLVAAEFHGDRCRVLSVGDSRAYLIDGKGLWKQLTRDHTILNAMIDRGEADADVEYASIYGMLDACLVADDDEDDFPIFHTETTMGVGDSLLLCSDGVHDVLGNEGLQDRFDGSLSVQAQAKVWRKAILDLKAPDNFSMIFLRRI